jgi:dihydrofolate reductase
MGKIIVFINLTLDGVMQAPAGPDEDTRGGFKHGGWGAPYGAMQEVGDALGEVGAVLFGRWTYESFYNAWANRPDNPFTTFFNETQKYVASTTLKEPLVWKNSTLLKGNIAQALGKIKKELSKNIIVFGSGVLIQSLIRNNLVDRYVLLIHPLVLGSGSRLFNDGGAHTTLQLISSKTTTSGVVIAAYEMANSRVQTTP